MINDLALARLTGFYLPQRRAYSKTNLMLGKCQLAVITVPWHGIIITYINIRGTADTDTNVYSPGNSIR